MRRLTSKWTFAVNALIVGAVLLAMSGACSMHDPGPYEGGGRSTSTPLPASNNDGGETPDTFVADTFVADTFVVKDTSTGN
jgi:hypothetical protein